MYACSGEALSQVQGKSRRLISRRNKMEEETVCLEFSSRLEGKVVDTAYIRRLAHQAEISIPLLVSLEEVIKLRKRCYDEFYRMKLNAPEYRHRFLSQQVDEVTAKGDRKKTNDLKNVILREE